MKRSFAILIWMITQLSSTGQTSTSLSKIDSIPLPADIFEPENQFSGLQVANGKLYLLSESRLQDNREAKIYFTTLNELERFLKDSSAKPLFKMISIPGLKDLRNSMAGYEGLEAFIVEGKKVYFSVETATPSPDCYILKGKIKKNQIAMDPKVYAVRKPRKADGSSIYNAGFEAISLIGKSIYAFYEYNFFQDNYVYRINRDLSGPIDSVKISPLPFRITDITNAGAGRFTAINYFYKGEGPDSVYRVPANDIANYKLVYDAGYRNFTRLVDLSFDGTGFSWTAGLTFPEKYTGYNWEGIAEWKGGYFVLNDKYTPARPNHSLLLYIH